MLTPRRGHDPAFPSDEGRKHPSYSAGRGPAPEALPEELVDRLAGLFPREALEDALEGLGPEQITGPGGLLGQLAGRVIETALGAELSGHLGYPPGEAPAGGTGNVRNGSTAKTVQTDLGPVEINTPRDRQATFEPQLVAKRQTRLAGLDDRVLDLYAGGMTVRDIESHLRGLYRVEIGRDTISRVTDAVLEDVAAWRSRPLERVYPIVYFDAMMVKVREDRSVRTRACYLAVGVTCEGDREAPAFSSVSCSTRRRRASKPLRDGLGEGVVELGLAIRVASMPALRGVGPSDRTSQKKTGAPVVLVEVIAGVG